MERFFRDIEITDFRGFDHLNMEKFSKVNVFVGANNVGKTSILEAICMLVGMSVPMLPARVNYWRKNSNVSLDDIVNDKYVSELMGKYKSNICPNSYITTLDESIKNNIAYSNSAFKEISCEEANKYIVDRYSNKIENFKERIRKLI